MSTGKLMSEEELADIQGRLSLGKTVRALLAHIDALQARTSADPMLVEARELLTRATPVFDGQVTRSEWRSRRSAWLARFDATHGGTPTAPAAKPTARDDDHDVDRCGGCGERSYLWPGAVELSAPPKTDCVWVRDGFDGALLFDCARERALYDDEGGTAGMGTP